MVKCGVLSLPDTPPSLHRSRLTVFSTPTPIISASDEFRRLRRESASVVGYALAVAAPPSFLPYREPTEAYERTLTTEGNNMPCKHGYSSEKNMENCISKFENAGREREDRRREPQPIRAILAELFAQYQVRFPEVRIAVVETSSVAA